MKYSEVLIVGGGLAGAAMAHQLVSSGIDVILLQKYFHPAESVLLGESIPPTAMPLFRRLGLEKFLSHTSHFKSEGYQSVWGSEDLIDFDFSHFQPPFGYKIDKHQLAVDILQSIAVNPLECKQIQEIKERGDEWHVTFSTLNGEQETIAAGVLVDATGRNSFVAKKMGDQRYYSDDLVAYCCNVEHVEHKAIKRPVLVESFEYGWGIVSSLGDKGNSFTLFTRPDTRIGQDCKQLSQWKGLLKNTQYLKHFIPEHTDLYTVKGMSAGSSILTQMAGKNWLAIGDAAMAFDPLSSHGVTTSLYSVEQAAALLVKRFLHPELFNGFKEYTRQMRSIYGTYLGEKKRIYEKEKRWKEFAFWQ